MLVLTEYVQSAKAHGNLVLGLAGMGLEHTCVTEQLRYDRSHWQNQILLASREPIERQSLATCAPEPGGDTNILICRTLGFRICGLRAPAYKKVADWYQYWDWLCALAPPVDLVIGDLNVDADRIRGAGRLRKRDRVLNGFLAAGVESCRRRGSGASEPGPVRRRKSTMC
ncbi:MAG: hypothetical protein R3E12_18515 [Candidatus Eisenbacteria bacterium]